MPTLLRLTIVIGALTALVFGLMSAMVTFLRPQPHEITQAVTLPGAPK